MTIYQASKLLAIGLLTGTGVSGTVLEEFDRKLEEVPGKFNLESRLRYEAFDQSGGLDVDGVSHRIRFGYTTPESEGLQGMIEGETVYTWGHGRDLHPADNAGDGTGLNQLWLVYRNESLGSVKLGRQLYTLDDHRFIGHVGWRQNIQTFDAATGTLEIIEGVTAKVFFIDAVNTVTARHNDIEAVGLNARYAINEKAELVLFYYSIDGVPDVAVSSNDTLGLRLTGTKAESDLTWSYALSAARQWENSGYPGRDFGHDYLSADMSVVVDGLTIGGGVEILGGNGIHGFSTPLATLHKFNGFADVFLGASGSGGLVNGLEDYQVYVGYTIPAGNGIKARLIHHWFMPRRGAGDYGNELDLVASYQINERFSVLGKYGHYESDGGSGGVGGRDKEMFTLEVNFIY